jgi:peptidoglycan/xylan/chitin deacetylase (PgdA/CDA1 family)
VTHSIGPQRDFIGYGAHPPKVVWPDDAKLLISLCVNYEEGSERSLSDGDGRNEGLAELARTIEPEYRDLCVESVYEYGSRVGVWRLLRLFRELKVETTFFAAAVAVERNPEVGRAVVAEGHEICSHGWRWEEQWLLPRDEEREHIKRAIDSFVRTCGARPVGWYCRYCPSVYTRELLVEEGGFLYDSDACNDDLPYFVEVGDHSHLVVPYSLVYNDVRYVLAQGFGEPSAFFDLCRRALDELRLEGLAGWPKMMSVGLHPRWSGQAGRYSALREFVEYALERGDVRFATRKQIAEWWLAHHEEFRR